MREFLRKRYSLRLLGSRPDRGRLTIASPGNKEVEVRRISKTSRGWIELDMADGWIGVTAYGNDGWEEDGWIWNERYEQQTLGVFLALHARLHGDEADRLAKQVADEWTERRESAEAVREGRGGRIGTVVLLGVTLLAVWGVVALVWLFILLF